MMSKIIILAVGKLTSEYKSVCDHFLNMISGVVIIEVVLKKGKIGTEYEGASILSYIDQSDYVVLLDVLGSKYTSEAFAAFIEKSLCLARRIVFVIGGAKGVSTSVKARANVSISLSDLTFPHMLARIMLLEQIYRAKSINAGHPYHKA